MRWKDVNFKDGYIEVRRTLQQVKIFDGSSSKKTALAFQKLKTEAGKRIVPLPPVIIEELKQHRKKQLEEKLKAGMLYEDND
ncbi:MULTISPECIES: hypothetical protein [unclassified Caldicellulosiruptor]|uniref:hypothetical protein n=1 Tax=unclassified Caldicellulosiruptor TaxID=2622462 RepID=UPI00039F365E|nr:MULTISPECIES: hypothetical protein [unclassified Caldicellulosiruptor]